MIKTIAVLLTCYNRREKTLGCLRSLYRCNLPETYVLDIFLVDDGSSDGTSEAVAKEFPLVHVILGNGQLYWNRGMHLAWDTAVKSGNFDFYLWLNDDVELLPNAIVDLLEVSHANNTIVVGSMKSRSENKATYGGRDLKGNLITPNGVPQVCNAFNGNLVLIPDSIYQRIGNLDPIFQHCIGDFDYALRAKKNGIKSFISTEYSGYCEEHSSLPQWCLPEVPFRKRIKALYSPLGNSHPKYYFIFAFRHYGIYIAIKHFFSIHLRLVYPRLWQK